MSKRKKQKRRDKKHTTPKVTQEQFFTKLSQTIEDKSIKELRNKTKELQSKIEKHGKDIDAISKSHDNHISILSNFARHDLKNSIHSIDSVISTNRPDEIDEEKLKSIKLNLNLMRETIDNFSKLVPHGNNYECNIEDLVNGLKLLNREKFRKLNIDFDYQNTTEMNIIFKLPFQSVLQMLNNLIINAIKALEKVDTERKIKFHVAKNEHNLLIKVCDNGIGIESSIVNKIFEYGISTTGGSGVGLYHAKYLCQLYDGNIEYITEYETEFNKTFLITLPILD